MTDLPPTPSFCPDCGVPISGTAFCARCAPAQPAPSPDATNTPNITSAVDSAPTYEPAARTNLRSALLLYFTLLAVIMAMTIAFQIKGEDITAQWQVNADLIVTGLFAAVVFGAAFYFRRSIVPLLTHLGNPAWTFAAPFIAMGTVSLASIIVDALNSMFNVPSHSYSEPAMEAGYGLWLPIFTTAVCPAITEELAFRGVMNTALDSVLDKRDAAIVTALLFAILHLSILSFPHLLVMGLVLGYIRHRTKSLYPCMLLHFSHNASVVLLEYFNVGF